MTTFPRISIVTPSFNQGKYLEKTILSVLEQGYPNLEYIIIDGGSTDESVEIIRKYQDRLDYWVSEPDRGQSHAINKGFERATGEILGFLNSDDLYSAETLNRVARVNWQTTDFCYGEGVWIDSDGLTLCRYPTIPPSMSSLKCRCTLCQPTVFFTNKVYSELGFFTLECHNSFDYEYWLRAIVHSKRFQYIPQILAFSRMHFENKTLKNREDVCLENTRLIDKYFNNNNDKELFQDQIEVIVDEYSRIMEGRLNKLLDIRHEGYYWENRFVDGWVNGSAKVLFKEKPSENVRWSAKIYIPSYNLPITLFLYNRFVTKRYEYVTSGYDFIPLNDMLVNGFKFIKPYIKINVDKKFSPSDYANSDDIRELGVLVNIVSGI